MGVGDNLKRDAWLKQFRVAFQSCHLESCPRICQNSALHSRAQDGNCTSHVHIFRDRRIQGFMPCNYVLLCWLIPARKIIFLCARPIRHGPGGLDLEANADRNHVLLYVYLRSCPSMPCSSVLVMSSASDECEKGRKTSKEKQAFLGKTMQLRLGGFLSGPSLARKQYCTEERKEYVARVKQAG